jgi:hypothetical protein
LSTIEFTGVPAFIFYVRSFTGRLSLWQALTPKFRCDLDLLIGFEMNLAMPRCGVSYDSGMERVKPELTPKIIRSHLINMNFACNCLMGIKHETIDLIDVLRFGARLNYTFRP